jgi:hypothetical protein
MKPHTGMQGGIGGVLLMAFSNTAQGDLLALAGRGGVHVQRRAGSRLLSVWGWWSDRHS